MKSLPIIIFTIILLSFNDLFGQKIEIFSQFDNKTIENCNVYNQDSSKFITSSTLGLADISEFDNEEMIFISHISYKTLKTTKNELVKNKKVYLSEKILNLNEVVYTSSRTEDKYLSVANKIDIINRNKIEKINPQTTADLLRNNGTVFVQQSQLGGGSPSIRGMESNRILLVVNGVRMNNAIYRAGHLQNILTIDHNMLERVEVLHGPGSLIYGSDAMGGVINMITQKPVFSNNDNTLVSGNVYTRYGTAANDFSNTIKLNIGKKNVALLVGFSTKIIGDLRQGANRDKKYSDWGKRLYYVEQINGQDSVITNPNPLIQKQSGYSQFDLFSKLAYKVNSNYLINFSAQYSNTTNVPRYDRLNTFKVKVPTYAEWYYGPQKRLFLSVNQLFNINKSFVDNLSLNIAYQNISEDRINRRFNSSKKRHQEETVNVYTFNLDLNKALSSKNYLSYGIDATLNTVKSLAYNENIKTKIKSFDAVSRYPDGDNFMHSAAAYITHKWDINKKLNFSQGLRFNSVWLSASYTPEMLLLTSFPIESSIKQQNNSINGSVGIVFSPTEKFRIASNISTGFRSPNIDDIGKINDSNADDKLIIIPNPDLKPEQIASVELTIDKTIADFLNIGVTGFYSRLFNAFMLNNTQINGNDSILYNGIMSSIQTLKNETSANIYGFETNIKIDFTSNISLNSNLTYTFGEVIADNSPLDHIPPMFGKTSLNFYLKKFNIELYSIYSSSKPVERYSISGEDNLVFATPDGTPAWYTLNFRTLVNFNKTFNIQFAIENILDKHYRVFASGISASGRNFVFTLKCNI